MTLGNIRQQGVHRSAIASLVTEESSMRTFVTALFIAAALAAPANARVVQHNVDRVCIGTLERSQVPPAHVQWWEINDCSFFLPSKASEKILAWCHEGDTCIVHAVGTLEPDFVISVDKLCTTKDGSGKTFACPSYRGDGTWAR
jgi:hypothetical protein